MAVTESRVARFVAAKEWPDVQSQKKYADGAFWFSCAGHGGTVVMLDRFTEHAKAALRKAGLVEFVVVNTKAGRGRTKLYYSHEYHADKLLAFAREHDLLVVEVAVGEEDCGWACVFLADDRLREGYNATFGKDLVENPARHVVEATVKRWNPDFYTRLTGEKVMVEESYVLQRRKHEADNAERFVTNAAWGDWEKSVPAGMVGVTAMRKSDGAERTFLVPGAEYEGRTGSFGFVVDEARHAAWDREAVVA